MQKDSMTILGVTAVGGAIGLFIRWLQNTAIFDAETGLARANAPVSWFFVIYCVAVLITQLVLSLRLRYCRAETDYGRAFAGRSPVFPILGAVLGCLTALGGLICLLGAFSSPYAVLLFLLSLLAVFMGLAMVWLALRGGKNGAAACLCTAVPVLFYCFWLIVSYKENSSNPVLWSYCTEILAISAQVLAWFFVAGYAFGRAKPVKTLFFCQLAAFLSIVAMADARPFGRQLLLLCPALMLLGLAVLLVRNLRRN